MCNFAAMINRSIIAQNITNLTDARYFAAWGVSYVSFNSISDSPYYMTEDKIREIKEWLEGPKCLIECRTLEFDELADGLILDNMYSSLPLSKESFFRIDITEFMKGLPDGHYIITPESDNQLEEVLRKLKKMSTGLNIYIDIAHLSIQNLRIPKDIGIVVQGGDEEKPGVKSYEDLDELYEILMDEQ